MRLIPSWLVLPFLLLLLPVASGAGPVGPVSDPAAAPEDLDLLLRGGHVLDGTGNPAFRADVGVRDGRVVAVGALDGATAREVVDVTGRVVAPGFIDIHSHAAFSTDDAWTRAAPSLVAQGITTVVINQDGRSPWPIGEQVAEMEVRGHGPNAAVLVGHGEVRRRAMDGDVQRPARPDEVERMQAMVREGLADGAWGVSAALEYNPGRWATTDEVVAVVGEVDHFGGIFVSHQRSEGSDPMWYWPSRDEPGPPDLIDAVLESIEVAERTGVNTVATHLKAKGAHYWGTSHTVIQLVEEARGRDVPIWGDHYPYETTGSDGNTRLVPAWAVAAGRALLGDGDASPGDAVERLLADEEGAADLRTDVAHEIRRRGGPDRLVLLEHPDEARVGQTLREVAESLDTTPLEAALHLQLEGDRGQRGGARMRGYSLHEMDIEAYAPLDWMITASDGGIGTGEGGFVHPRFYGTFPRKIARYARDRGVVSVPHAVRSATSLPAQVMGMRDRGQVREGFHADLVVLDLPELEDRATLFEPHQFPRGVDHVFVGGEAVVRDGELTGALPGRVLRPDSA